MAGENSPTTPTDDKQDTFPKSQSFSALVDQKTDDRSKVSDRYRKSRSVMIENLQFHAPPPNSTGPPPPKSATLPSNFQAPIPEKVSESHFFRAKVPFASYILSLPTIYISHSPHHMYLLINR